MRYCSDYANFRFNNYDTIMARAAFNNIRSLTKIDFRSNCACINVLLSTSIGRRLAINSFFPLAEVDQLSFRRYL